MANSPFSPCNPERYSGIVQGRFETVLKSTVKNQRREFYPSFLHTDSVAPDFFGFQGNLRAML